MQDRTNGPPTLMCHFLHWPESDIPRKKHCNYTVIKGKLPPGGHPLVSKSQTGTLASAMGKANQLLHTVGSEPIY